MALRTATHDIHERMHRHPALARLAAGTIGCDEYRRVLARSYGFYAMAEPVLGLSGKLTDCIVQDLVELGMRPRPRFTICPAARPWRSRRDTPH